jgi:hypothetical protein
MTSISASQLTLNLEASLPDKFGSLREYISHRVMIQKDSQKVIAAHMDMAPSMLSRKLNPHEGDTQRFNLDDLESYIKNTGDAAAVIEYIAAKYLDNDEARSARAVTRVESLINELAPLLAQMKGLK